jgi:hypothetical protein
MNLEERLQQRICKQPPQLRARIVEAVADELAKPVGGNFWPCAAIAAAAIIAMNLAVIDGSLTEFTGSLHPSQTVQNLHHAQQIDALEKGAFR